MKRNAFSAGACLLRLLAAAALAAAALPAADRQVAITIDDLPIAHSGPNACDPARLNELTTKLLGHFANTSATIFAIGNNCPNLTPAQRLETLRRWIAAGAELGNHTFSHRSLLRVESAAYHADILRNREHLRQAAGKPDRFFRSPMLHTAPTLEKKVALEQFLARQGLRQSPVTLDNSDWLLSNALAKAMAAGDAAMQARIRQEYLAYMERITEFFEKRSVEIVGREFPQILLIHANVLNAEMGGELLAMFRRRGYRFISLEEAMRDPAYRQPDGYIGERGISVIHRWTVAQGRPIVWEPDEPAWIVQYVK